MKEKKKIILRKIMKIKEEKEEEKENEKNKEKDKIKYDINEEEIINDDDDLGN